jgi:hypothetical protein
LEVRQVWKAWKAGLFAKSGRPPAPSAEPIAVFAAGAAGDTAQVNFLVVADFTHDNFLPATVAVAPAVEQAAPTFAVMVAALAEFNATAGRSATARAITVVRERARPV